MEAVRRASQRLSQRLSRRRAPSAETLAALEVIAAWAEDESASEEERALRATVAVELKRAHLHATRFATAEAEMAHILEQADSQLIGASFRDSVEKLGLKTPGQVWEAVANHLSNDGLLFLLTIGPNVQVDAAVSCLPTGLVTAGSLAVHESAGLKTLPSGLHVQGSLVIGSDLEALPDDIVVDGALAITGESFERLPDGMRLAHDLLLTGCETITSLANVRVGGNLLIEQCKALVCLPALVAGSVKVLDCPALEALPSSWDVVHGALELKQLPALQALPEGLRVEGALELEHLPALHVLPWESSLHVIGHVTIEHCAALENLPADELRVDGKLTLSHCGFTKLPARVTVTGTESGLELTGCDGICALPEEARDWRVDGDVRIGLRNLEELPEGLAFLGGGVLSLKGCASLQALPPGLHVETLNCSGCSSLAQLPADIEVESHIWLADCVSLVALPSGLHVKGSLFAPRCVELEELPPGLRVDSVLDAGGASELVRLPSDLNVGGNLDLSQCKVGSALSSDMRIGGDLHLAASKVTELPEGLHVGGKLTARGCRELRTVGRGLTVGKLILLSGCTLLEELPADLHVHGNLNVDGCSALTSLPAGLRIDGTLHARDSQLTRLPDCIVVAGHVDLDRSNSFIGLERQLDVGGYLSFTDCQNFRELPADAMESKRSLFAERTPITSLPRELRIGHDLRVQGCEGLTALPPTLVVANEMHLEGCTGITALPDCVLEWEPREGGGAHNIYVGGAGLTPEELARVQAANNPALRLHVTRNETVGAFSSSADDFANLEEAADFWKAKAVMPDAQLALGVFVEAAYLRGVLAFLSKLRRAKEFTNSNMRKGLASRVVEVLELVCGEDNGVREELLVRMTDSVDACGDKPIWALNQMQLLVRVCKARGDREKLRELGRAVMRLEVVHRHVRSAMDAMNFVDDVCVYLRFEIALREPLDLPVSAEDMLYPSYITVAQEAIDAAKEEALALSEEDLEAWLPAWSEWQRQDRVEYAEELDFAALKRNSTKRLSISLRSLLGSKVADPVRVRPAKAVWSLEDLMKHWINTGMDLNNTPRDVDYMRLNLTKCI